MWRIAIRCFLFSYLWTIPSLIFFIFLHRTILLVTSKNLGWYYFIGLLVHNLSIMHVHLCSIPLNNLNSHEPKCLISHLIKMYISLYFDECVQSNVICIFENFRLLVFFEQSLRNDLRIGWENLFSLVYLTSKKK